jgi:uncharacterized UPF0160 family protein
MLQGATISSAVILSDGRVCATVNGVPDAVFCHNHRFVAAAKSKEGAIRLAQIAVAA